MRVSVTTAGKILHQLLRRCATERIILTRRGKPVCWLHPFPKTRDEEILQRFVANAPQGLIDFINEEK